MSEREETFLKEKFQSYYKNNTVNEPPKPETREFGFGTYGKKISNRHVVFKNYDELNTFLREDVPFYISASSAYYKFPEKRPMNTKELQGADLIYEFDADDIKTKCKDKHDTWACENCNLDGTGNPEKCTNCGERVSVTQWFCPDCLNETKKQVFKLIDFLENDFGFTGLTVNFSGNAGYHVHIRNEAIHTLSHTARIELLDYLTANNLNFPSLGFVKKDKMMLCPDMKQSFGWGKRISEALVKFLTENDLSTIAEAGNIPVIKAKKLIPNKELLLKKIQEQNVLLSSGTPKELEFWNALLEHIRKKVALDIDRQTSIDMHKIVRVPDTIHGGTGLLAKTIEREKLKEFDPFTDALVFSDSEIRVFINKAPELMFKGKSFGKFENTEVSLPEYLAIYLIARGAAELR
ncbi:MAG: DNA primase small subunit domain-containing protein [Candidatus Diapherotrites archaeon]